MKGLLLGLVLLVLFVHFGGSNVPKVLKDNKQMVYGVTIGLVLCSFFGVNVEGWGDWGIVDKKIEKHCTKPNPERKRPKLPIYSCSDLRYVYEGVCGNYYQIGSMGTFGNNNESGDCYYSEKANKCLVSETNNN